jgi:hypothetical protein
VNAHLGKSQRHERGGHAWPINKMRVGGPERGAGERERKREAQEVGGEAGPETPTRLLIALAGSDIQNSFTHARTPIR